MKAGPISDEVLPALSSMITERLGLDFPQERWTDLKRGITAAATKAGANSPTAYAQELLAAPLSRDDLARLAQSLTIGETYFFRERHTISVLAEHILPELVTLCQKSGRKLRIWCAGCCTGEEPYTIAILLDRLYPGWAADRVVILGTDVNPEFLKTAARGHYSNWSFRSAPLWLKDDYFTKADPRGYEIAPRIRERVTFVRHNLAEDPYPSKDNGTSELDLILCRNVTMYFSPAKTRQVIEGLYQSLNYGGYLLVSPTEASTRFFSQFTSLPLGEAMAYRKDKEPKVVSPSVFSFEMPVTKAIAAPAPPTAAPTPLPLPPLPEIPPAAVLEKDTSYDEALALFEQGDYAAASKKLRHDSALPERAEKAALLARISANLGQLDEARTWSEKALSLDKMDASLHYLRALILQEQGNATEAAPALKRALYLDPKLVMAHFSLGNLAARQGKLEEADRCFVNVVSLLADYQSGDVLPHSDGLAAGQLKEMVERAMTAEARS